jgi:hypothetical protein
MRYGRSAYPMQGMNAVLNFSDQPDIYESNKARHGVLQEAMVAEQGLLRRRQGRAKRDRGNRF